MHRRKPFFFAVSEAIQQAAYFVLLACLFVGCSASDSAGPEEVVSEHLLVGAHYYLWYPGNFSQGFVRARLSPAQEPEMGLYASSDPRIAEQHIAWASQYGIDFFTLDWWPSRGDQNQVIQDGFLRARNIADTKFCIFYEMWDLGYSGSLGGTQIDRTAKERFVSDMRRIAELYFSHSSYLTVSGRPVVILYLTRTLMGEYADAMREMRDELSDLGYDPFIIADEIFWLVTAADGNPGTHSVDPQPRRIELFDAITAYNYYDSDRRNHQGYGSGSLFVDEVRSLCERYRAAAGDVPIVPSLIPGYNDRGTRLDAGHYVIPRQWAPGAGEGSLFTELFDRIVSPFIDPRLPMVLITSWNEWNEDTAIEPLAAAPSTSQDMSPSGSAYTQGYEYSGFGLRYLELLRDKLVAVSGRVTDTQGTPVPGLRVAASSGERIVGSDTTDSRGYFTLSRYLLPAGDYSVSLSGEPSRNVTVVPSRTISDVDFTVTR